MNKFKVAHLREQGVDLIIIPLEKEFAHKSPSDQGDIAQSLQICASSAGLDGTVVPVGTLVVARWDSWLLKTSILISAALTCNLCS